MLPLSVSKIINRLTATADATFPSTTKRGEREKERRKREREEKERKREREEKERKSFK